MGHHFNKAMSDYEEVDYDEVDYRECFAMIIDRRMIIRAWYVYIKKTRLLALWGMGSTSDTGQKTKC